MKNFRQGKKWLPGHILNHRGPVSFEIQLEDGRICHHHQDQIRKCVSEYRCPEEASEETDDTHFPIVRGDTDGSVNPATAALSDDVSTEQQQQMTSNASTQVVRTGQRGRYPQHVRRPPDCLTF